jgi:transmembrane protein EpsG
MAIYLVNLLVVYISSLFARIAAKKRNIEIKTSYRLSSYFIFIALISLILVAGLRNGVGTDYYTYHGLIGYFYELDFTQVIGGDSFGDKGFSVLTWVIGRFTIEPQVAFLVYAMIIIVFVVLTIKDYGSPFELSMAVYILGLSYYSSFNGLRQWIACAVIFWGVRYVIKGNWKKYFLIVSLVSFIHLSAVIMLLVYFLIRVTNWKYTSVILTAVFAGGFLFYSGFIESIFTLLDGSQYGHYSTVLTNTDNGANILRVLVWAIPIGASLVFRTKLGEKWPEGKYIVRLSFIGFLFAILSLKNASIYRMCMYFDIYNVLIIPRLATLFDKKTNRFIYYCIFICYFLYSYLVLPCDSNLLPYRYFNLFQW